MQVHLQGLLDGRPHERPVSTAQDSGRIRRQGMVSTRVGDPRHHGWLIAAPAGHEMIVPVQVEPPRIAGPTIDSYLGYLEPEVHDNMGLVVARTVAPVKNGCTVARLLNPTDQELKLRPGSHLGVDAPLPDVADCPLSDDQRQQLQALLGKHQGVFSPARGGTGNPNLIKHHIQTDSHPLPRIDDTLDALAGATWFSTLDFSDGYWQVEVAQEDREKTAFTTGQGLYQFRSMPMGLTNAPATFQQVMELVLKGLPWHICMVPDLSAELLDDDAPDATHTLMHTGTQTVMDNDPNTVCAIETPVPTTAPTADASSGPSPSPHLPSDLQACVDRALVYTLSHNGSNVRELQQSDADIRQVLAWLEEGQRPPRRKSLVPRHHAPIRTSQAERPFQRVAADILELPVTAKGNWVQQQRTDSPAPSRVSMKSDWSMGWPVNFKDGDHSAEERVQQVLSGQSVQQHPTDLDSIFKHLEENVVTFVKNELKKFQKVLSPDYPECSERQSEDEEVLDGEEEEQRRSSREAFLKITLNFLRRMKQEELADCLQSRTAAAVCRRQLKSDLQKKFQCVFEGIAEAGNPTLLNQIYTELYITEGGTAEVNDEHEVRQIETASRKPDRPETTIRQEDIFKASPGRDEPIRRVMTKGVAGIGKTVLTQKFTLDWAEDKANQDIQFTFPFTFRELNVLKEKKFSLVELVHHFFTETKEICSFEEFQVVFIFDGLDECRLPLDFHNTEILTDVTESTSVDVLLANLIRGKLLPSARLWITTRPAAANQIPPECVDMVTEVRGFTDPQKEEYFKKRFRDEEQASRIISHIKTSRSLHIMCHIPVFCWITATVLEDVLKTREGGELPKTLTEMYIHFLVVQSKVKKVKYDGGAETDPHWTPESRKMIKSLGKLAFEQLQKGNLIFYESDLTECGIDIRAASVYSGVFTQIFKEESGLYQDKVFCFVHLSVQEFLAALHVHLTFIKSGVNLLAEGKQTSWWSKLFRDKPEPKQLYQSAVDKALQSPNGHLDLFLRFLLGLSLETNQTLLRGLMTHTGSISQTNQETVKYIKKKISENLSPERSINLFHCLNELNDGSLVKEIQQYLRSGSEL
ncbi:uncharacterized protein [Pagrus major]|uniref:uncharacterized protein n=1 Tax=Pagrus major TaxID=143350 RepID=UPI003CC86249